MEIIPAILPKNYFDLEEKLGLVHGLTKIVQIDVCDGRFTPRASWPYGKKRTTPGSSERATPFIKGDEEKMRKVGFYSPLEKGALLSAAGGLSFSSRGDAKFSAIISENAGLPFWENFDFEIDLMVSEPALAADDFVSAGASRLVVHLESIAIADFKKLAERLSGLITIGVALNITTPIKELEPIISLVSFVQCMGIARIGFQGEVFDNRAIVNVASLREKYPELKISVDGGVNLENAPRLVAAGANRLVVGSVLFESGNIVEMMRKFKSLKATS